MSKTYKSYDEELKKTLVSLYENGKKISVDEFTNVQKSINWDKYNSYKMYIKFLN